MFQQQCGFCSEDGAESINIAPSSEFTVAGAELGSDRTKGHHFRITAPAKRLSTTVLQAMLLLAGPAHLSPAGTVTVDPQRIC